jgi:predicted dehydrogenase
LAPGRTLVLGFGSAGQRHSKILAEMGWEVGIVTSREIRGHPTFPSLEAGLAIRPDYIVVATPTSSHAAALRQLAEAGFTGPVLVEKPLGFGRDELLPGKLTLGVGYNLRFHPAVVQLRERLGIQPILAMHAYAGQFLPDWRPTRAYQETSSAQKASGGGVLRDLSHELDLVQTMAGRWDAVTALGGHSSSLEIDSDDTWAILLELDRCSAATVQLNYLHRPGMRQLVAVTDAHTYMADLMSHTLVTDGQLEAFTVDAELTYRAEHAAMLTAGLPGVCSLREGLDVMDLIAAVEASASTHTVVTR